MMAGCWDRALGGASARRRAGLGLLLVAIGSAACVDYLPLDLRGGASVPVVLALVEAGRDSVFVGLGRVGPGTETGPEPGATLTLATAAAPTTAREVDAVALDCRMPDGFSCYLAVLPQPVAAGDSVRLTGVLAAGAEIAGATRVPGPPPVRLGGHVPGDTLRYVDRPDAWPVLDLLPGTAVRVEARDSALDVTWWDGGEQGFCPDGAPVPVRFDLRSRFGTVPAPIILPDPSCDGMPRTSWDSLGTSLAFVAFDPNATEWYDHFGGILQDDGGRWGVEGALGLFGSFTPGAFVLRVLARPTSP